MELSNAKSKAYEIVNIQEYFMRGNWNFVNQRSYEILGMMSPQEREEFFCDTKEIEWEKYLEDFNKGLVVWTLKEDKLSPEYPFENVLMKNYLRCTHLRESFAVRKNFMVKDSIVYEKLILNEDRYYKYFKVDKMLLDKNLAYKKNY